MRVHKEKSYVLRTIPFTESSLIVDVFSRNHGRLNLLAKSARRVKSQFRGVLRPFQLLSLSWSGKGEVPVVTGASLQSNFLEMKGEVLYVGSYLNELLIKLLHKHDPVRALFDSYEQALNSLHHETNLSQPIRIFEKKLLKELGYGLILDTEADRAQTIQESKFYTYEFDKGPICVARDVPNSISGAALLALAKEKIPPGPVELQSRRLLSDAMEHHLNGRKIHSREIYRQTLDKRLSTISSDEL